MTVSLTISRTGQQGQISSTAVLTGNQQQRTGPQGSITFSTGPRSETRQDPCEFKRIPCFHESQIFTDGIPDFTDEIPDFMENFNTF